MVHMFDLEDSLWKTIVLRWNEYSFCSYMGPKQVRIYDGPNAQPTQCKTPSEYYKNRYLRRYWPATNWILCWGFCCGSTVCHWWRFFLFGVNILNLSRPRLIKLAKIWKPLLLFWDCVLHKDGAPRVVSTCYKICKESLSYPGVLIRMV